MNNKIGIIKKDHIKYASIACIVALLCFILTGCGSSQPASSAQSSKTSSATNQSQSQKTTQNYPTYSLGSLTFETPQDWTPNKSKSNETMTAFSFGENSTGGVMHDSFKYSSFRVKDELAEEEYELSKDILSEGETLSKGKWEEFNGIECYRYESSLNDPDNGKTIKSHTIIPLKGNKEAYHVMIVCNDSDRDYINDADIITNSITANL